jgi:hypothetical protein
MAFQVENGFNQTVFNSLQALEHQIEEPFLPNLFQRFDIPDPLSLQDRASSLKVPSSYNPRCSVVSAQQLGSLGIIYNLLLLGIPSDCPPGLV